jgi:hypothetical protein
MTDWMKRLDRSVKERANGGRSQEHRRLLSHILWRIVFSLQPPSYPSEQQNCCLLSQFMETVNDTNVFSYGGVRFTFTSSQFVDVLKETKNVIYRR